MTDVERFYADHRDGVFRYLRRIVGAPEAARDLTQEVFLRVSRAGMPDASEVGRRAWLFKIARNLALNHVRDSHRRPPAVELGEIVVPATQELGVAMRRAIEALPALDRRSNRRTGGSACRSCDAGVRTGRHGALGEEYKECARVLGGLRVLGVPRVPPGPGSHRR